eukprot:1845959-Pyramimonas_sp.AAC.1
MFADGGGVSDTRNSESERRCAMFGVVVVGERRGREDNLSDGLPISPAWVVGRKPVCWGLVGMSREASRLVTSLKPLGGRSG